MSGTEEFILGEKQQQQQQQNYNHQQQQSTHSISYANVLTLCIGNMSELSVDNMTYKSQDDHTGYLTDEFQSTPLAYAIIFGFVCAFLCFLTITGNLLVLIIFRRIRTVGNLFILSLATADLTVGCFVMPIAGIYAIMEKWKMGLVLCKIWISVDFIASTASIFNLLTLSLDRYWSITSPLQYLGKRTRTRALLLTGIAWGLSLLWIIPIFGWHRFNQGDRHMEPDKCEPEYTHSKVFKVSTAVLNFYLPLLVLILLNGRIYYEIKRRYKNVLLQRHSTKTNDSIMIHTNNNHTTANNNNNAHLNNHKLSYNKRQISCSPITVTLCDSDKHYNSSTIHAGENDSIAMTKIMTKSSGHANESALRINVKEKKNRPSTLINLRSSDPTKQSVKRTYSFIDKTHCTQDDLTWVNHRRQHSHSSFGPMSSRLSSNYKYSQTRPHHLSIHEHSFHHNNECNVNEADADHQDIKCEIDSISPSARSSTTMHVFNLCPCCTSATSESTTPRNSKGHNHPNTNNESLIQQRRASTSSLSSSIMRTSLNRKHEKSQPMTSLRKTTESTPSHLNPHSTTQSHQYSITNPVKQTTVWNQQEKAFRQLFAIVFGFTCCFLPYFILYMVVAFCGSCVSERVVTATIWLGYVNSTINPFLYALSNKHFRRTFNRLLKRNNRPQSYYN